MPTFSFPAIDPERFAVLMALGFFLGLAFEEYFAKSRIKPPGGVRTFPLLSLTGALLYALEPEHGLLFLGGLAILGTWLSIYYRERLAHQLTETDGTDEETATRLDAGIMAPTGNLLAFLLGPIALAAPLWVAVSVAVAAVLLTGARESLHALAAKLGGEELSTLGKFLIVIGIVLPLVPHEPVTTLTDITPYEVWLAVVAVSTLSYASYLVQRFLAPRHGVLISAALGGLYSSTATTVVLSRRVRANIVAPARTQAAIVLATAIMFLRIIVVVGVFTVPLALKLLPSIAILCPAGLLISAWLMWSAPKPANEAAETTTPTNPLELSTAIIFAVLFIALSIAVAWAKTRFGENGIFALGMLAGFTDVDPFVLSLAQGTSRAINLDVAASAILLAASSNNLLKASYTLAFAGRNNGLKPALALFALSAAGILAAFHTLGWF
ncbi:DUF4010 domain-containing protein [Parvibaculum sedimenti]|uniref:DUF4010 domain-containing protein n=1 Tax=Parvibaculum sedimenti TaxID=2608632 RepID=A0A6N6VIP9_9HYPH|nr:DUF4010 domain-containing protein [Parvibaculum sedimenti]KAB7741156.1 DUF4010 domain-containing protein [Parvibaculum sedimenti]